VAPRVPQLRAGESREVDAVEQDFAGRRRHEPIDAADQRALAGARRSDDRVDAGLAERDVDVA